MKSALIRTQSLVMRALGVNRLQYALGIHSDAIRGDLRTQLDRNHALTEAIESLQGSLRELSNQLSEQGRATHERGETDQRTLESLRSQLSEISNQLSEQGRATHERGETDQRTLNAIVQKIDEARVVVSHEDTFASTLGELRAEISALRSDFSRELETLTDDLLSERRKSLNDGALDQ